MGGLLEGCDKGSWATFARFINCFNMTLEHKEYQMQNSQGICPDKGIFRKCFRCKDSLKCVKHSPIDISLCSPVIEAKIKADHKRRDFQLFLNNKLELKFMKLAKELQEVGAKLLRLRAKVHETMADLVKCVGSTRKLAEAIHLQLRRPEDDDCYFFVNINCSHSSFFFQYQSNSSARSHRSSLLY